MSTRNFYEEFASEEDLLRELHDSVNAKALQRVRSAWAELIEAEALRAAQRAWLRSGRTG
ncbi:hypothetical protein SAMN05216553_10934 [Lentzea fradiae]|uniref:Uncharacterized protein n=1 Tax=Lentzea fradiae TaxID=200378 RepID=A0A1G7V6Z1_9PSEU|nr:hypothetical protein [Lentzea fradiae]SDG55271.1 hypothetical protein SAMN05216553_10934 [Lentzea fradiae]